MLNSRDYCWVWKLRRVYNFYMNSYNNKMENRIKRATGQLQGILRMMEEDRECVDVITQLSAVRSSLDSLIGVIVAENLKSCLLDDSSDKDIKIEQAIKMIIKKWSIGDRLIRTMLWLIHIKYSIRTHISYKMIKKNFGINYARNSFLCMTYFNKTPHILDI